MRSSRHFGSPDRRTRGIPGFQKSFEAWRAGPFVKLSALRQGGVAAGVRRALSMRAARSARLGTDWPFVGFEEKITYAQCVAWIESWIPDAATRRVVMAETPAKLFHFEEVTA